jgi:glutamyl-tRNA synthetase
MSPPFSKVRTRIAPSPTGDPHIGTAYIALFNHVFAKYHGGSFILRIEDTDQSRSDSESERSIFNALRWIGIPWDEGPDVGGSWGPYRQSERTEIYLEHCDRLVDAGHAYFCFAGVEDLDAYRTERQKAGLSTGYDGSLGMYNRQEARSRIDAGEDHVIRLKVPAEGECVIPDALRGEVRIPWSQVDHQVLLKSDGFPTYHLASVVDDHLMEISHVIRGEEWINSTPKHLLLYDAFGWEKPQFFHLPLLRNPDRSKLSKRKNPTSIGYYRKTGILSEALLNYLGLMAYSMPDDQEVFSFDEMVEHFDPERISLGGPVFDMQKLLWLNGLYLREKLAPEDVHRRLNDWMLNEETWNRIIPLAIQRMEKLSDFVPLSAYLFADRPDYQPEDLILDRMDGGDVVRLLRIVQWELESFRNWNRDGIKDFFSRISENEGLKLRDFIPCFYVAVSGRSSALPLFDSMEIIGRDMTRRRVQYALEALAGSGVEIKGKALKKLEKDYQKRYHA